MTKEQEPTAVNPNERLEVEGGSNAVPIPTTKSHQAINDYLDVLDHAIAAAKRA
jgi:hypothetical protein